ncbi:MAG TPA: hypothetical protein VIX82_05465 [Solirubrobacteraceae bacterium]
MKVGRKSGDPRLRRRARRSGHTQERTLARAEAAPSHRPHGGPPEDRALYSCGCGFVFQAAVSTSVACPHCGSGQAW